LLTGTLVQAQTSRPALEASQITMPKWAQEADNLLNEEKVDKALAVLRKLPAKYHQFYEFHILVADIWDGKYQETNNRTEEIKYLRLEQDSLLKAKQLAVKANARHAFREIDDEIKAVSDTLKQLTSPKPKTAPQPKIVPQALPGTVS
jgi:hypothetical protein